MVIDASVWVAAYHASDIHHQVAANFLEAAIAADQPLNIPTLAVVEIAGAFARQTGSATLATRTVRDLLLVPRVAQHTLDEELAERAVALAARCRLRGGDAVYAALAQQLRVPLISLDRELLLRTAKLIRCIEPSNWSMR